MSIKIGNLDVSYFKVGGANCSIYLGSIKMYPSFEGKYQLTLSDSTTVSAECDATSAITQAEISAYTSTTVAAEIGDCVTSIDTKAFYRCQNLASIVIPSSVTTIGSSAFFQCASLTSIELPYGVTSINNNTFNNCTSLSSVTIPSGVTSIGDSVFYKCYNLTSVNIGIGVASIGNQAFRLCSGLTSVTVLATTPPTLGSTTFGNTSNDLIIYVPAASVSTYKSTTGWSDYASRIQAIPTHDYSQDYLTYVALGDNFELSWAGSFSGNCLSYSTDNGSTWSEPSSGFVVTLANSGDTIMFKGSGMTSNSMHSIGDLRPTDFAVDYKVQGNIMSLLFGDNFVNQTDLTGYAGAFLAFFQGANKWTPNARLLSVENLVLPATTLGSSCYQSMFNGCTSLTTAPELPATTLATQCYQNMFQGCTSLTTAPVLSATTLANNCYRSMFSNCTNLNSITCLATDISASYCTNSWVNGVAANGTFTKAASMTNWTEGTNGIPSGWTVVDYSG